MSNIQNVHISGLEIANIIEAIGEATKTHSDNATLLGCLAMTIILSRPEISKDRLIEGVKDLSNYLVLWLSTETEALTIN